MRHQKKINILIAQISFLTLLLHNLEGYVSRENAETYRKKKCWPVLSTPYDFTCVGLGHSSNVSDLLIFISSKKTILLTFSATVSHLLMILFCTMTFMKSCRVLRSRSRVVCNAVSAARRHAMYSASACATVWLAAACRLLGSKQCMWAEDRDMIPAAHASRTHTSTCASTVSRTINLRVFCQRWKVSAFPGEARRTEVPRSGDRSGQKRDRSQIFTPFFQISRTRLWKIFTPFFKFRVHAQEINPPFF